MVGVMNPLDWAVVEKSQALMSDQFFVEVRVQIMHLRSCILAEILPILDCKPFRRGPKLCNRVITAHTKSKASINSNMRPMNKFIESLPSDGPMRYDANTSSSVLIQISVLRVVRQ